MAAGFGYFSFHRVRLWLADLRSQEHNYFALAIIAFSVLAALVMLVLDTFSYSQDEEETISIDTAAVAGAETSAPRSRKREQAGKMGHNLKEIIQAKQQLYEENLCLRNDNGRQNDSLQLLAAEIHLRGQSLAQLEDHQGEITVELCQSIQEVGSRIQTQERSYLNSISRIQSQSQDLTQRIMEMANDLYREKPVNNKSIDLLKTTALVTEAPMTEVRDDDEAVTRGQDEGQIALKISTTDGSIDEPTAGQTTDEQQNLAEVVETKEEEEKPETDEQEEDGVGDQQKEHGKQPVETRQQQHDKQPAETQQQKQDEEIQQLQQQQQQATDQLRQLQKAENELRQQLLQQHQLQLQKAAEDKMRHQRQLEQVQHEEQKRYQQHHEQHEQRKGQLQQQLGQLQEKQKQQQQQHEEALELEVKKNTSLAEKIDHLLSDIQKRDEIIKELEGNIQRQNELSDQVEALQQELQLHKDNYDLLVQRKQKALDELEVVKEELRLREVQVQTLEQRIEAHKDVDARVAELEQEILGHQHHQEQMNQATLEMIRLLEEKEEQCNEMQAELERLRLSQPRNRDTAHLESETYSETATAATADSESVHSGEAAAQMAQKVQDDPMDVSATYEMDRLMNEKEILSRKLESLTNELLNL